MDYFKQRLAQQQVNGLGDLGSWLKRAVSNTVKFVQQTDLVSHALTEVGVGKTTVGKILVPSTINVNSSQTIVKKDIPKPKLTTVDAVSCAKTEFMKDPKCVEFLAVQNQAVKSQNIISATEATMSTQTKLILGGAFAVAGVLIYLANKK